MGRPKIKLDQVGLLLFGAAAIYLVGLEPSNPYQKWGYVVGLISQPFWLYATYRDEQWGIFYLSIFYTYSWSAGIYNHFNF
ncbi:hypothetical protein KAR91_01450 [Candidatus Pacearchaeota archaeon]|nr:hypothetical protein [Candidatus Pacearchaeota archaeon]